MTKKDKIKKYLQVYAAAFFRKISKKNVNEEQDAQKILDYWWRHSKERRTPRKLLRFEVNITDHCNLNCAMCEHFSPIAPAKNIDVTQYENDCKRLGELLNGEMEDVHLMGGEPLLHPELSRIVDITRKYFPKGVIEVVTNGILVLKQDETFWHNLKKNNAKIAITQYPIKLDFEEIKKRANKYEVPFEWYFQGNKTMQKRPFDLEGTQDIEDNFDICHMANTCIQLRDGKLFTCVNPTYISIFNEYFGKNMEVSDKDYIDIYKAKNKDEILNFLAKPIPFCRYCNIKEMVCGLEWRISKKDISEWM
jgi:MoaA/NifB/PqqE/SkfB family radical SAM enzyme